MAKSTASRFFKRKANGLYYRLHRIANEGKGNPAEKVYQLIPQNRPRLGNLRTPPTDVQGALPVPIWEKDMHVFFDEVSPNDLSVTLPTTKAEPGTKLEETDAAE